MSVIFGGFVHIIGEDNLSPAAQAVVAYLRAMFTIGTLDKLSNITVNAAGEVVEVFHFQTGADHICVVLTDGRITDHREREYIVNGYDDGMTRIGPWQHVEPITLFLQMTDTRGRGVRSLTAWREAISEWEWMNTAEQISAQDDRDAERDFLTEQTWDTDRYDALSPAAWQRLTELS